MADIHLSFYSKNINQMNTNLAFIHNLNKMSFILVA